MLNLAAKANSLGQPALETLYAKAEVLVLLAILTFAPLAQPISFGAIFAHAAAVTAAKYVARSLDCKDAFGNLPSAPLPAMWHFWSVQFKPAADLAPHATAEKITKT